MRELLEIKYWIFDLDNTLYSGQTKVFSEVDKKMSSFISEKFNVDIHPSAEIGRGIMIDHASGVVIGETARVGDYCSIFHGVTLGGVGAEKGQRHP